VKSSSSSPDLRDLIRTRRCNTADPTSHTKANKFLLGIRSTLWLAYRASGRDVYDAAGNPGVHGRPAAPRRDHRDGREHDLCGQLEGDRGRWAVVHPRHADPAGPLRGRPVAPRASRPGHPRQSHLHPATALRPVGRRRNRVIYYQYRTTGAGAPCAASTSRSPRQNQHPRSGEGESRSKKNYGATWD
jgi:hypothetical protein